MRWLFKNYFSYTLLITEFREFVFIFTKICWVCKGFFLFSELCECSKSTSTTVCVISNYARSVPERNGTLLLRKLTKIKIYSKRGKFYLSISRVADPPVLFLISEFGSRIRNKSTSGSINQRYGVRGYGIASGSVTKHHGSTTLLTKGTVPYILIKTGFIAMDPQAWNMEHRMKG